jgi:hypothetical protein
MTNPTETLEFTPPALDPAALLERTRACRAALYRATSTRVLRDLCTLDEEKNRLRVAALPTGFEGIGRPEGPALGEPEGDGRTRDAVRAGLGALGFSDRDIECKFIPAMALRNEIDVGHVELGLFTLDQLTVIHSYTERSERAFHEMFERLLSFIEAGKIEIVPMS